MSKLLINLRNVPNDEADEIRVLLEEQQIEFYETEPSSWGVSGGGIWVRDDRDLAAAQRLLTEYQSQRRMRARAEYHAAKHEGTAKTTWASLRDNPLQAIGVLLGIAFLVAVLALPFLMLSE